MRTEPLFAAIIPAHNVAKTLPATLDSLLAQSATNWEAVVVSDGSTDGTCKVAMQYAGRDPRIRVVSTTGIGVSRARNLGLTSSGAPWVLFLDADDWVAPEFFEELGAALEASPQASAAYCGSARVVTGDARHAEFGELPGERMVYRPELGEDPFAFFTDSCPVAIHSILVRRDAIEAAGRFDPSLRTSEDWDLWLRIARDGARFVGVPRLMAFYRLQPGAPLRDPVAAAEDARRIISRAHEGHLRRPSQDRTRQEARITLYFAGIAAGHGQGARQVLESLQAWPDFSASEWRDVAVAELEAGLVVGARSSHTGLAAAWPRLRTNLEEVQLFAEECGSLPGAGAGLIGDLEALVRSCAEPA
jgi:glycosyltransferase involved in cell wall biosynthesis